MATKFTELYKKMNAGNEEGGGDKHAAFRNLYKSMNGLDKPSDAERLQMLKQRIELLKKQLWLKSIREEKMPGAY